MINKVILVGNVGNAPEIKQVNESPLATFSLATSDPSYTTKDGKKVEGKTQWHRINVWRGLAGVVEKYVNKGDRLYIEGKIDYQQYEDKNGNKQYFTVITASELKMLGGVKSSQGNEAVNESKDDGLPF